MANTYVLYNPLSGGGMAFKDSGKLEGLLGEETLSYFDITKIADFPAFFSAMQEGEKVIVCGGDGTLYYLAGNLRGMQLENEIYYYPTGTGNDFWNDLGKTSTDGPALINGYLQNLPSVTVNGEESVFLNAIGYGIDGYCCEEGEKVRAKSDKPVNYAAIAVKGLLFDFKPRKAIITVDGQTFEFDKTWLAATMHGRFYGGGMMAAPEQVRNNAEGTVSLFVWQGSGKLKTLMAFPSIFKGEHVKYTDMIKIMTGKEITVSFDRPTPLQIDGELIKNVTQYTVKARQ